jgi:hypothetical protein
MDSLSISYFFLSNYNIYIIQNKISVKQKSHLGNTFSLKNRYRSDHLNRCPEIL